MEEFYEDHDEHRDHRHLDRVDHGDIDHARRTSDDQTYESDSRARDHREIAHIVEIDLVEQPYNDNDARAQDHQEHQLFVLDELIGNYKQYKEERKENTDIQTGRS